MNTTCSSHSTMIELSSRASWEITGLRQKYPRWIGLGIQVDWLSPISLCLTTSFDLGTLLTQKSTHWNPRASVRQAPESQPSVPVNLT